MPSFYDDRLGFVDQDSPFADQLCLSAFDSQTGALGPVDLARVIVMRDPLIAPLHQRIGIDACAVETVQMLCRVGKFDGAQHRLRRDARIVRALAAQQLLLDDERLEFRVFGRVLGCVLTDRAATDDDDIGGQSFSVVGVDVFGTHINPALS